MLGFRELINLTVGVSEGSMEGYGRWRKREVGKSEKDIQISI